MTVERTLVIIKPDALERHLIGVINQRIEQAGFNIVAMKMVQMTEQEAFDFYAEHQEKPFFKQLINFMHSGPMVVEVLEGDEVIMDFLDFKGDTDPHKARIGTLRHDFAESAGFNVIHGSDGKKAARREIDFFFNADEICSR